VWCDHHLGRLALVKHACLSFVNRHHLILDTIGIVPSHSLPPFILNNHYLVFATSVVARSSLSLLVHRRHRHCSPAAICSQQTSHRHCYCWHHLFITTIRSQQTSHRLFYHWHRLFVCSFFVHLSSSSLPPLSFYLQLLYSRRYVIAAIAHSCCSLIKLFVAPTIVTTVAIVAIVTAPTTLVVSLLSPSLLL